MARHRMHLNKNKIHLCNSLVNGSLGRAQSLNSNTILKLPLLAVMSIYSNIGVESNPYSIRALGDALPHKGGTLCLHYS